MNMIINGKQTIYSGGSISVINGRVIVDGKEIETDGNAQIINIVVEGNAGDISGDFAEITVKGSAESVKTLSGNVTTGDVKSNVKTMSGNVNVEGSIGGNAKTMSGNIRSGSK